MRKQKLHTLWKLLNLSKFTKFIIVITILVSTLNLIAAFAAAWSNGWKQYIDIMYGEGSELEEPGSVTIEDNNNEDVGDSRPESGYDWGTCFDPESMGETNNTAPEVPEASESDKIEIETTVNNSQIVQKPALPEVPSAEQFTDIKTGWYPVSTEPAPEGEPYLILTEEERATFAILLYLESGAEPFECQFACGSVVLNRFTMGKYDSIIDVIYEKNQFSPAKLIKYYSPKQEQLDIVDWLCMYGPTIPEYVTYFRANRYHSWDTVEDWKKIEGNTADVYFSYDPRVYNKWLKQKEAEGETL